MDEEKKQTIPYLSARKLAEMVELVSSRGYPEGISTDFFKKRNFSPADATLAVNTLKFLNLIDEAGMPTANMPKIRIKGDDRKPEFEKIFRSAYKKLFDTVDDPMALTTEKLFSELVAVYGVSDRVARSAIPAFYKLAEYGGLREEKEVSKRAPSASPSSSRLPNTKKAPLPPKSGSSVRLGFSAVPVAEGRLEVHMPEDLKNKLLDDDNLSAKWSKARLALKELADAHNPPSAPETSTTEDDK